MTSSDVTPDVATLLRAWARGDRQVLDRLLPLVYPELRNVARTRLRQEPEGHTLQTTALVHETYLRLVQLDQMAIEDRAHFFAMAARLMRQILVDHARRKRARKRGGAPPLVDLDEAGMAATVSEARIDMLALDEALGDLADQDARLAKVVELRAFGGFTLQEIAQALDVSLATVKRDWSMARAWLYRRLTM